LVRRGIDRSLSPAVEDRIFADGKGQASTDLFQWSRLVHVAQLGCLLAWRKPCQRRPFALVEQA
jgi:hypothetical protein